MSRNLRPEAGAQTAGCESVRVAGVIDNAADTWMFPAKPFSPGGEARFLHFEVSEVEGFTDLRRDVQVQLVGRGGKTLILEPDKEEKNRVGGTYVLDLREARAELGGFREIRVGWGRYRGRPGERFGFHLSDFAVLDEKGNRVEPGR